MMFRFTKFLKKLELDLYTFRDGFQVAEARKDKFGRDFVEKSAVIIVHPEKARTFGFRDGQMVKVSAEDRSLTLRLKIDESAPKEGALMPESVYSSFLGKRVTIEPSEAGEVTDVTDLLQLIMKRD